ncbi:MAG: hypothetical protein QXQ43_03670 [Nitrososphaerota archaeon]
MNFFQGQEIKLVNLTPHPIVLRGEDGVEIVLEPSGVIARLETTYEPQPRGFVNNIPILVRKPGQLIFEGGIPEGSDDTIFIVSSMVLEAMKAAGYTAASPDGFIRDDGGRIIAATKLVTI